MRLLQGLICGDCLDILPCLPKESVDLVLTDPPWNVFSEVIIHRSMNPIKYRSKTSIGPWDHFKDKNAYFEFTRTWLREVVRILKMKGHLVSFFDLNQSGYLIEFALELGLKFRQHVFWLKTNPVPCSPKLGFTVALEHACWFTKGTRSGSTFNYQLGQQLNYVRAAVPSSPRLHPTQKALKPLRTWIRYLTKPGDLVLDPFAGSGSTGIACILEGRNYILIEKNEKYARRAAKWLRETRLQLRLF